MDNTDVVTIKEEAEEPEESNGGTPKINAETEEDALDTPEETVDTCEENVEETADETDTEKTRDRKKKKTSKKANNLEMQDKDKGAQTGSASPTSTAPCTPEASKPPLKRRTTKVKTKPTKECAKPKSPKIIEPNSENSGTPTEEEPKSDRTLTPSATPDSRASESAKNRGTPSTERRLSMLGRRKSSMIEREKSDAEATSEGNALRANLRGILKKFELAQTDNQKNKTVQFGQVRAPSFSKSPSPRPPSTPSATDDDDGAFEGYGMQSRWNNMWLSALRKVEVILPPSRNKDDPQSDDKLNEILHEINKEIENGRLTELVPTVNGLKQFGIAKSGITRAVVNFTKPPEEHPLTLCFHFPHTFLNHSYVRHMVLSNIRKLPGSKIVYIQYQDRNVFHGARAFDNRWIVKVSNTAAFDILRSKGIEVCNRKIAMRPYDDILKEEYEEYLEYVNLQKRYMYDQIRSLVGMPNQAPSIARGAPESTEASGSTQDAPPTQEGNTSDDDSLIDYEDAGPDD